MPAIITREFSQRRLGDFINTVKSDKKLYIGLGKRATAWAGDPDQIEDTPAEKTAFWDELLGIKKIAIKDVVPMVPDRIWMSGIAYEVFDESKVQAFDDAFYVINSNYEVFMLNTVGTGHAADGLSYDEPILDDAVPATPVTGTTDGYIWDYMFTVNRYEYQQTPAGWLSVNFGSSVDNSDTLQDLDSFVKLGARYLLTKIEISDPLVSSEFTSGAFKQVALLSHPRLTNDDLVINTYEDVANLKPYSGYMLYLENRTQEDIIDGQNADLKITLRF